MSSSALRILLVAASSLLFATSANSKRVAIRLLSVDAVSYNETLSTEWRYGKSQTPPPSLKWLLKVRFAASPPINSANFPDYNVYGMAYPCSMRTQFEEANENLEVSGIVERGVALHVPFTSKEKLPKFRSTALSEYYAYLSLVPFPNSELGKAHGYDLIHKPEDVCVEIAGGRMWGLGVVRSNVVRIPKKVLVRTLMKAGVM